MEKGVCANCCIHHIIVPEIFADPSRTEAELYVEFLLDQGVLTRYVAFLVKETVYLQDCYDVTSVMLDRKQLESLKYLFNEIHNDFRFELRFPAILFDKLLFCMRMSVDSIVALGKQPDMNVVASIIDNEFIPLLDIMLTYDIKQVSMAKKNKAELYYHIWDVIEFAANVLPEGMLVLKFSYSH